MNLSARSAFIFNLSVFIGASALVGIAASSPVYAADTVAPTITITSPTNKSTYMTDYMTDNTSVDLAGTATDDVALDRVTWSSDRGGNGICDGTDSWIVTAIPLCTGTNTITLTAVDTSGNMKVKKIAVKRVVGVPFERTYTFNGGFQIDFAEEDALVWNYNSYYFSPVITDPTLANKLIQIKSIDLSSPAVINSSSAGGWDWDVFLGESSFGLPEGQINNTRNNPNWDFAYTASNQLQVSLKQPAGPGNYAFTCSYDARTKEVVASSGLDWVKSAINPSMLLKDGLYAQLFFWTGDSLCDIMFGDTTMTISGWILSDDTTPPTINVSNFPDVPVVSSTSGLSVKGTATDDTEIKKVEWTSDRGEKGVCQETSSWDAYISLQSGENRITFTATDTSGNTASREITVVYNIPKCDANGHYYEFYSTYPPTTWWHAKSIAEKRTCNGFVGHLATITSADERDWIKTNVRSPYSNNYKIWLGGFQDKSSPSYSEPAGGWRWVTEEPWGYNNWPFVWKPSNSPWQKTPIQSYLYTTGVYWYDGDNSLDYSAGYSGSFIIEYEPDVVVPIIYITGPTSTAEYTTNSSAISISGYATDDYGVDSVTWTSGKVGGTADGNNNWVARDIPLALGNNKIIVTASDKAGHTSSRTLDVTYHPGVKSIYCNDFSSPIGSEWSTTATDITPKGLNRFLGPFQNGDVKLTLNDLPAHSFITVNFDMYVLRDWDGFIPSSTSPMINDRWKFGVDDKTIMDTTFGADTRTQNAQSYPGQYMQQDHPTNSGAAGVGTLGFGLSYNYCPRIDRPADAVYKMNFTVPHNNNSAVLCFSASDLKGENYNLEEWGIDNISVSVGYGTPATPGYAKTLDEGTPVYVEDAIVTAANLESGVVFVESSDRAGGIKLLTDRSFTEGQRVRFTGIKGRVDGELQVSDVSIYGSEPTQRIRPLAMTTKSVAFDSSELLNRNGIDTSGLLVRLAGKVTSVSDTDRVVYVEDGGLFTNGTMPNATGVRVRIPLGVDLPAKDSWIVVTGISRIEKLTSGDSSVYVPCIWLRSSDDLTTVR